MRIDPGSSRPSGVLLFSSATSAGARRRWMGLEPGAGRYLLLSTGSMSTLGYEHEPIPAGDSNVGMTLVT